MESFLAVVTAHKRVALCGGPRAGKTTLALLAMPTHVPLSTDLWIAEGWDAATWAALSALDGLGASRWLLEGVRAPWCLRQGLLVDAAVWLGGERQTLSSKQQGLAKAARSVWDAWVASGPSCAVFEL